MIASTLVVLMLAAAATSSFAGVDPNTLSCDPEGHIFLLLPHFTDCSKFYICAHGNEVEMSCSAPLIFDFELQVCNWAWAAKCTLRTPPGEEGESAEDSDELLGGSGEGSGDGSGDFEWNSYVEESGDKIPSAGIVDLMAHMADVDLDPKTAGDRTHFTAPLNCARAEDAARQIAYKGDCQRFWRCINGALETAYCTDGLFFNENKMQCDFEANVKCNVNHEYELQGEFIVYDQ